MTRIIRLFTMHYPALIFALIVVTSIVMSLLLGSTRIEKLTIWSNLTLGSCAVAALFYQNKTNRHQNGMRKWEINRNTLINLAITLSDAIESTNQSIREHYEDEANDSDAEVFKRLHKTMRHTIDIHAVLLDDSLNSSIAKYKEEDDRIRQKWEGNDIEYIDALQASEALMQKLLEHVKKSIKLHASP